MKIVNIDYIPGYKIISALGVVEGNSIKVKHIGKDILSELKTIVGGHLSDYEEMMTEARDNARKEMIKEAEKLGADAVVNFKYTSSSVIQGAAEALCYGTAVKIIKL